MSVNHTVILQLVSEFESTQFWLKKTAPTENIFDFPTVYWRHKTHPVFWKTRDGILGK